MDLREIEAVFNEDVDFNNLVKETAKYIENALLDSDNNFLSEEVTDGSYEFNQLRVEYNKTYLMINKSYSMPSFRLKFYLYKPNAQFPAYTYEVEYNCCGEFLDEYFLEY